MIAQDLQNTTLPVSAKGVVLVDQLLSGGGSPVYAPIGEPALEEAVRRAGRAADGLMDRVAIVIAATVFARLCGASRTCGAQARLDAHSLRWIRTDLGSATASRPSPPPSRDLYALTGNL
jgi:hypothetical protein